MNTKLPGRYTLISHGNYNSEDIFTPTSDFLKGELIYSQEGYLSVQISFKPEIETARDILSYSGTYKIISDNEVDHHINICSQPRRDHSVERRSYLIEADILKLSVVLDDGRTFEAKWKKLV